MASWLFTPSAFEVLVDKATSPLLPIGTHDVATNFDVADAVRAKTAPPRAAAQTLKRKLQDRNPNVQLLALRVRLRRSLPKTAGGGRLPSAVLDARRRRVASARVRVSRVAC